MWKQGPPPGMHERVEDILSQHQQGCSTAAAAYPERYTEWDIYKQRTRNGTACSKTPRKSMDGLRERAPKCMQRERAVFIPPLTHVLANNARGDNDTMAGSFV